MTDNRDILEKLRDLRPGYGNYIQDAIDEIERLRASAVGAGAREASRLLNKIVDLADDENAVDPLDDAIEYAKKALACAGR